MEKKGKFIHMSHCKKLNALMAAGILKGDGGESEKNTVLESWR